jgi:aryl-phospho-beta-D-glucosidase BglC (GH1 family)
MNNLHTPVLDTCLEADPEYMGLEIGEFMDHFIDKAKIFGMTVLIDQHTILGKIPSHPWSETINSDMTINAWISFLKRFSNKVFAIELKNEPHDDCSLETYFTWCGEAIHRIENETNYRGLYFISGVQLSKSDNNKNHAWGGTFNDLESSPDLINKLGIPINRLVFCPHVYGTSVRSDSVVNDGPPNWDADFGFIKTKEWELKNIPVIFSEMGGFLTGTDIDFYNRFKDYAHDKGLTAGLYWWSLPSTSVDTGGLIENDFKTIDA